MTRQAYDKKCIALAQLETALRLFCDGDDLFSVITLAGAAQEILGDLVKKQGRDNSLASLKRAAAAIHKVATGEAFDEKELKRVGDRANSARNAVKHLEAISAPTITMDVRKEAVDILTRAVDNYWLLENSVTPAMTAFDHAQHAPDQVQLESED